MRKLILYIATSADGYIATEDESVAWLEEVPNPEQSDYDYAEFYDSVSSLIMGNKTYQQVRSFGEWPYMGKESFVFSRSEQQAYEHVRFVTDDHIRFVEDLKADTGSGIWLVGGGQVSTLALDAGLIDEIMLFQMPVMLGSGLPLFPGAKQTKPLKLIESKSYASGVTLLHYQL